MLRLVHQPTLELFWLLPVILQVENHIAQRQVFWLVPFDAPSRFLSGLLLKPVSPKRRGTYSSRYCPGFSPDFLFTPTAHTVRRTICIAKICIFSLCCYFRPKIFSEYCFFTITQILLSERSRYNARHIKQRRAVLAVLTFARLLASGSKCSFSK